MYESVLVLLHIHNIPMVPLFSVNVSCSGFIHQGPIASFSNVTETSGYIRADARVETDVNFVPVPVRFSAPVPVAGLENNLNMLRKCG